MPNDISNELIELPVRKCPHLGMYDDLTTWSGTDQVQNFCHLEKPPEPVEWEYQKQYCFCDNYVNCPIYQRGPQRGVALPALSALTSNLPIVIIALVIVLGGALWFWFSRPAFAQTNLPPATPSPARAQVQAESTPTSTLLELLPSATPTVAYTFTSAPTHTATQTAIPLPSETATPTVYASPTVGPASGTPFLTDPVVLVHKVTSGESLEMLSRQYNTSEAALRAANGLGPNAVLWLDFNLVVLPGVQDASSIQPRIAVYVEWPTTVTELAEKYKVAPDLLRAENGMSAEESVPGKRWIVFPKVP